MKSKLKAAWLCPCIGTGGADALMTGLIRYCQTVEFTGVGILRTHGTVEEQVAWARYNGLSSPLHLWFDPHTHDHYVKAPPRGVDAYPTPLEAARAATAGAEIAISWCCGGDRVDMRTIYPQLDIPVIELAQNEDQMSRDLVWHNHVAAHYYAACSLGAARCFPEDKRDKVQIIYNGIDPIRCAPRQGREATRQRLGYADNEKVILFLGRLVAEKNPEAIIQALTMLPPHYKALVVGRGPEETPFVDAAKRYAPERVQLIDFCEHPGDFYAAADCFCLPSDFEGDPLAVHEAQLAGVPCVVSEYSAVDELEEIFGRLYWRVPKRPTSQQISQAILEACELPDDRVPRAREVTWRHFLLASISLQWEELLHECVADWRAQRLGGGRARRLMNPRPMVRP